MISGPLLSSLQQTTTRFLLVLLFVVAMAAPAFTAPAAMPRSFDSEVRPILNRYCVECHGNKKSKGGVNYERIGADALTIKWRKLWTEAHHLLRTQEMPPDDKPQPSAMERERVLAWLEQAVQHIDSTVPLNAGRNVMRRLTRFEYKNTMRDLLGVEFTFQFDPTTDFPSDAADAGFDTNGAVLSMSQAHLDQYFQAAGRILDAVLAAPASKDKPARSNSRSAVVSTESYARLFHARPGEGKTARQAAVEVLAAFAPRAFRRPVLPEEVADYVKIFELGSTAGMPFEKAMQGALQAILVSPHFLFRVEPDRLARQQDGGYAVNAHELATRLSYFLWSSTPDDELAAAAASGKLVETAELEKHARRMLADPKARALGQNFATQWLAIRSVESFTPDTKRFGAIGSSLRDALVREPVMFFQSIIDENRSLLTLLDADYTFLNEDLAKIYKIALPPLSPEEAKEKGSKEKLRRVTLTPDMNRGGVMMMSAVLMSSSNPTRTSLVKRGKWVLDNLLGMPPPPPTPDVPPLEENEKSNEKLSLRQQVEKHRADPACAGCHKRMDPIGFALENYDAIGRWRDKDESKQPIDASAVLPDGTKINGPADLKKTLLAKQRDFALCLAEKLLTYGLGRSPEPYDRRSLAHVVDTTAPGGYKLSDLIVNIVKSYPFRNRRLAVAEQSTAAL